MPDRRRLLVSLFNPEEVRGAVAGGADVIDCEDARSKVGMFKPRTISDIAYAVRQNEGAKKLRISANIGFDLRLYQGGPRGTAVARSLDEVQAKAAQEALGIAVSMDTGDHRPNIVKCGVDGLPKNWIEPVVRAVKSALAQSYRYQDHQVIAGVLETNLKVWHQRRSDPTVIEQLLKVGQFHFDPQGDIDIRDPQYHLDPRDIRSFMDGVTTDSHATLIDPYDPTALGLSIDPRERLREFVTEISKGGADGVMIDTPVSAKMAGICLVEHPSNAGLGVFDIETLTWFSQLCAYHYIESWFAGSINASHAQALAAIEHADVVLNRGASSEDLKTLFPALVADGTIQGEEASARPNRRIRASRVQKMADAVLPK